MNAMAKIIVGCCSVFLACNLAETKPLLAKTMTSNANAIDIATLKNRAAEANTYCKTKNLNTEFFLLADLKRHSGLKRFYIWDFAKDTISDAFLVSHGCGQNPWAMDYSKERAGISNTDGSHLSSVGKYIIGNRGYSNWGINVNYLLHGQENTNSNAVKRQIVLHSWEKVPDVEIYPAGTPEGWGCPALSDSGMRVVDAKIRQSKKAVLLWVVQ